ncbi:MAG: bifunctional nuclease family protein [Candidatus Nanopelagicales bacterium]|nr:bifunctional nuclease family protein [Candidatus Nanopelagicales bacterium]MDZ4250033.1 bifunctional nuclease family protein [Candidatus Nanopelagicales bacterium]MDZ7578716.1 bifunctional nuclease family protein [Candidatus Nanopelagicales bacterium]
MRPVDVVGVRLEMPSNQPVVLLRETGTSRYLPIWIGTVEATAIAFAQEGVTPPRPMTHDLIRDMLEALKEPLKVIQITHLEDGVFFATMVFKSGLEVSARPSDAIAIALRTGTPVEASEELLDSAGVAIEEQAEPGDEAEQEQEVERFREFLDQITPEDFQTGGGTDAPSGS